MPWRRARGRRGRVRALRAGDLRGPRRRARARAPQRALETTPFAALDRARDRRGASRRPSLRRAASRGGARVRDRRARRGRIDPHRTIRRALRTGGVPFALARTTPPSRPPQARPALRRQRLGTRGGVLPARVHLRGPGALRAHAQLRLRERAWRETTQLFEREPVRVAIDRAWRGGVVRWPATTPTTAACCGPSRRATCARSTARTTVVILGDGRTNYHDAAPEVLDRIRDDAAPSSGSARSRAASGRSGDSAMARYAPRVHAVLEVRCARDLENAARRLVAARLGPAPDQSASAVAGAPGARGPRAACSSTRGCARRR